MLKKIFIFLWVFVFFYSCKNENKENLVTTPAFDTVLINANKTYDSGNRSESLQMVIRAHASIPNLTMVDEMNYFIYCIARYDKLNNYDKCISLADSILLLLNTAEDSRQVNEWRALASQTKANALFAKGLYTDAYSYYFQAKKLARDYGDSCSLKNYAYSLAMVLYKQHRFTESALNFKEAYNESLPCPDCFSVFYFRQEVLDNIGLCYNAIHEYDSAMRYYTKALNYLTERTGKYEDRAAYVYESAKGVVYGNMAEVYEKTGKYDTAIALYNRSISINLKKGYVNEDAVTDQTKLADMYLKTSDMAMMSKTLANIKAELDTIPHQRAAIEWNRLMWKYYERTDDSVLAYRYLSKYISLNDAYASANKSLMATDMDARVKEAERQYEINLLTRDKQQQQIIIVIVTIIAIMAFIIVFLSRRHIEGKKTIDEHKRLSEARYRNIFNNSQALITVHSLDGTFLDVNKATIETTGYSYKELVGSQLFNMIPADKQDEFALHYIPTLKREGKASGIMILNSKAGKKIYLLYQNYLVTDDGEEPYGISFAQDITLRIEAERALKKSEEKFRSISANMNLGLMELDENYRIVYVNNSFCQMSGYDVDELLGKNPESIFLNDRDEGISDVHTGNRENNESYEEQVTTRGGLSRWWLISRAHSYDKRGRYTGSIRIHLDITIQKNLEQALRKAKSDVERSAHTKDIFLANMSHEIRTPMNAILGIEQLLSKTILDGKQRHYLATMQNATNNLLVIINDLLDFSKIEAGKVTIENVGFELNTLIQNVTVILKYKAAEKSIFISNVYSRDIAQVLIGDPYRINQVLMNLLSNSIKFTDHGSVSIECAVVAENEDSQDILFKIVDTGIGMSKEFIEVLFNKFAQEDDSNARKLGGTGLGMSICKELVELMGGTISVKSIKNLGTTISFVLKFTKGSVEDLPVYEIFNTDVQAFKGKRILLVEDNEANRLIANTIFSNYGAEVIEAENGEIAIGKFQESHFDLILMDVRMPVMDGLQATRYIRANINDNVPIIALTANALKEEEEKCLQAGMSDFVSKPFNENKLVQVVAHWLESDIKIIDEEPGEKTEAEALFSLDQLRSVGRGRMEFVVSMVGLFIGEIPENIREIEVAFYKRDWESLSRVAHFIKPSIHNMGISSLYDDIDIIDNIRNEPGDIAQVLIHVNRIKSITAHVIEELKQLLPTLV